MNKASFTHLLPLHHLNNIRLFYILTALNNLWFISANWIFYWLRFMDYRQLGIMDAICFFYGLIMEIPSGAIADLIGKHKTVMVGMVFATFGFFFMGSANTIPPLWIGFLLAQTGWAFYSGAAEALAYDSLVDVKKEKDFEHVIAASHSLSTITTIAGILIGGIMFTLHQRSTHLAMSGAYILAFIFSIKLTEPHHDTEKFNFKAWKNSIIDGTKQLAIPNLKPFFIVILLLMGAEYMYEWGLLKPAIATGFGFMDKAQAVLFGVFGITAALLTRKIPTIRKHIGDKKGLYLLTLFMGAGFILASFPLGLFGLIPMVVISLAGNIVYPWISIIINKDVEAKYRATTLSAVTFITKVPYILTAIIAGSMIQNGKLWLFNLAVGLVIISAIGTTAIYRKRASV